MRLLQRAYMLSRSRHFAARQRPWLSCIALCDTRCRNAHTWRQCPVRLLRRLLAPADGAIQRRQHLLRRQDHGAAAEVAVEPVLAGVEEGAEIADPLAEGQQL